MKTVVVGLSGGVDSSVAAYLLKKEGYNVIGIFMKNWHDESVTISDECPWIDDSQDALLVANKLGIPFQTIDLSEAYREKIVDYMFAEYESGRTPNPDVLCNREIKFDVFMKTAMQLGADYVATGHYCRKGETAEGHFQLLSGKDNNKDQSYFLCQLTQSQLAKSLFPIGEMQKSEVRAIAREQDLITADKKDSQGLCFIGKVKLPTFLQQQLKPKTGNVIEIPADLPMLVEYQSEIEKEDYKTLSQPFVFEENMGEFKGEHQGAHYFTIGQRKGLGIGGTPLPLFIVQTNTETNTVYVGQGEDHPALNKKALFIKTEDAHWVREDLGLKVGEKQDFLCRIRYRQPLEKATLFCEAEGTYILFENLQKGISPGQFAAWYQADELIGSGVITS
ncbi:tRNA 2-thiouridine(34) synthase MnmA [Putridiphycobacter roseus]|uniref:tRNA-specific 2-thiouridylase MnmA n=1 Tax=Putridiphycobacter roseus TaxID=2219161 RepID=A0A2W1MYT9_9FLAO|nr:tRNA 2-thiouridine(34) synthase MnmA [Putridiphycobacter roseus]PZE17047.1 tRNA 2-thiouridine(34) synthase MnmA [Putridiphycobacter roseus]